MTSLWDIPKLPFIFTHPSAPTNGHGLPDTLRFHLGLDESTGRLTQIPEGDIHAVLEAAYAEGSRISGQMDEVGLGRQYADDFIESLAKLMQGRSLQGLRVLEIGCGTGYLLSRLQAEGAQVLGIEPGHHAPLHGQGYGVEIVRDFFPSPRISGSFDVILTNMVLEHIVDPSAFVATMLSSLAPGGMICTTVPNAEVFIEQGDLSILFHEHFSYFTAESLHNILVAGGLRGIQVMRSSFTNVLYAVGSQEGEVAENADPAGANALARSFRERAGVLVERVRDFIQARQQAGQGTGIYVPGRFANMFHLIGGDVVGLRFFDDNPMLLGTYFPGIPVVIENFDALLAEPPPCVLIMSLSFGAAIRTKVEQHLGDRIEVVSLRDLCTPP